LSSFSDSQKWIKAINNQYALPFIIRGRLPKNIISTPGISSNQLQVFGLQKDYISDIGLFFNHSHPMRWAQNYLNLIIDQEKRGFEFDHNSHGYAFFKGLQVIMDKKVVIKQDQFTDVQKIIVNAEELRQSFSAFYNCYEKLITSD